MPHSLLVRTRTVYLSLRAALAELNDSQTLVKDREKERDESMSAAAASSRLAEDALKVRPMLKFLQQSAICSYEQRCQQNLIYRHASIAR